MSCEPMPRHWYCGSTDMGPKPNQPVEPSEMETGDMAHQNAARVGHQ
jgi:hypothetical protein